MLTQAPILSIRHMSCQSGSRYLLYDLNWEVQAGENWVVFGANGSGKTTLLSIIAGFRSQSQGEVRVLGESFASGRVVAQRQRIGYVSGSFLDNRYSKEAALDVVLSGVTGTLAPNGLVDDSAIIRAKELLEELEVASKAYETLDTLSKGERQKIFLARALMGKPQLLLLDEPATGLDLPARERLLVLIETIIQQKALSVIYVTHHAEEVTPSFDHALFLKNGRVFAQGPLSELFTAPVLSDFYQYPLKIHTHQGRLFAQREGAL